LTPFPVPPAAGNESYEAVLGAYDVDYRVGQHNFGTFPTCYTYTRRPVRLVYATEFRDANEAINWEKQIKRWSRAKKAALARGDYEELRRLSRGRGSTSSP
jgi:putative endonuclease